jgi:LmbE family N-acetylglucosaminyl deacetylase
MLDGVMSGREVMPDAQSVLVVCAHPDDESFGLGAAISTFTAAGTSTSVLCLTHGEASTLGADVADLGTVRSEELAAAAAELGVDDVRLLNYGDGRLTGEPLDELSGAVAEMIDRSHADLLLVFDEGGITGHADHCRATEAALAAAHDRGLKVLAWAMSDEVADALNREFSAGFVGRDATQIDVRTRVNRERQERAIACHVSQSRDNPVLRRRLALQGEWEVFRWLTPELVQRA